MIERPKKPAPWIMLYWASSLSGVSLELGVCVLLGYWGDRRWGTAPWLLVVGSVVGLAVSIWHLWQLVQQMLRFEERNKRDSR